MLKQILLNLLIINTMAFSTLYNANKLPEINFKIDANLTSSALPTIPSRTATIIAAATSKPNKPAFSKSSEIKKELIFLIGLGAGLIPAIIESNNYTTNNDIESKRRALMIHALKAIGVAFLLKKDDYAYIEPNQFNEFKDGVIISYGIKTFLRLGWCAGAYYIDNEKPSITRNLSTGSLEISNSLFNEGFIEGDFSGTAGCIFAMCCQISKIIYCLTLNTDK